MKDDIYYFHQTPKDLCEDLIDLVPLEADDVVLEPFKGEGNFYDSFPDFVKKEWCEIEDGRDYKSYTGAIDWVITNPPFRMEDNKGKRINSFFPLLEHFASRVNKGICFLGNDQCFSTLTPLRMKRLNEMGLYLQGYTVCNVKKWRGRYFFMLFMKKVDSDINYLIKNYE